MIARGCGRVVRRNIATAAWTAFTLGFVAPAWGMDYVVIRAEKATFSPGAVLKDGQALSLPADGKLVLVGENGKTVNLSGPFSGTLPAGQAGANGGVVASLSRLMTMEDRNRSVVGAYKGQGHPDPWAIRPGGSETACVKQGGATLSRDAAGPTEEAQLWSVGSPAPAVGGVMALGTETGNVTGRVRWESGVLEAAWPSEIPVSDGTRYRLSRQGAAIEFTVAVAPAKQASIAASAAWMAEKGCIGQALLLIGQLR